MDENDPIYQAIDLGGGQTCDVAGVLRELLKAGYVICKSGNAGDSPQDRALDAVRSIAAAHGANNDEPVSNMVIRMLGLMWANAVRAQWEDFVAADPELTAQHAVALELMKEEGYGDLNPVCMIPGRQAMIAKVDNQEAVCVDHCMAQVMPLSSIYVNRVRLVQSAAARVADRLAKEAAKDPDQSWPIKTAGGEVFNSIEEMKASTNEFIRGLAESMEKGAEEREKLMAEIFNRATVNEMAKMMPDAGPPRSRLADRMQSGGPGIPHPTCWQYFGFDGPVEFERLNRGYQGVVAVITPGDNKLAAEAHRQYQNCLRELGTAIMSTPATSGETSEDE